MAHEDHATQARAASDDEAVADASVRRDELLRGLRHELRTPINHIVGYSELLLEIAEERGYADLLADLARIRAAGAELAGRVNESLDNARREAALPDAAALSRELRTPL